MATDSSHQSTLSCLTLQANVADVNFVACVFFLVGGVAVAKSIQRLRHTATGVQSQRVSVGCTTQVGLGG